MKATSWTCYIWKDDKGVVRYVGCGGFTDAGHPAVVKWKARFEDDSPLHVWLQSLDEEPAREVCGLTITSRKTARHLTRVYRSEFAETLLKSRGSKSINGGGGSRAVVYCPDDLDFQVFASVRKAAEFAGCNASNITRKCQNVDNDEWVFADEDF